MPNAILDVVDFSQQMLDWAKKKLGSSDINYMLWDYSVLRFTNKYDIVISVIWIHHQTHEWKKNLFQKIYNLLNDGGNFIFWDLVTYKDAIKAASNHALHFHRLVENATDSKTLWERAHHHMYLNNLAPYEDQIDWLEKIWFWVKVAFLKINTCLLIGVK